MSTSRSEPARSPITWVPSLYFVQGLQFFVVMLIAGLMFKNMGVPNDQIARWTGVLGLAWAFKPLWSPFLELARSKKTLVRTNGSEELLPAKVDRIKVEAGDLLLSDTWGGGGCGDPLERDPSLVQFDVDAGLVTVEGARRYGVVLKDDLSVDAAATTALRKRMSSERGEKKLFDRGFDTIENLKARCRAETGLEPPQQPQFARWTRRGAA